MAPELSVGGEMVVNISPKSSGLSTFVFGVKKGLAKSTMLRDLRRQRAEMTVPRCVGAPLMAKGQAHTW